MRQWLLLVCGAVLSGWLVGCSGQPTSYIMIWHGWNEAETAVLTQSLTLFADIHPEIKVVAVATPANELQARYTNAAASGLGPDILIGTSDWLATLYAANLVRPIAQDSTSGNIYQKSSLDALTIDDHLYGIPLSLQTAALYYNTTLVETPAKSLEALLGEAQAGKLVALGTQFERAFWGVRGFGQNLFAPSSEETEVEPYLSLVKWLVWLKEAQETPNIILGRDEVALRQLFAEGRAAYYVGFPEELPILQEALGKTAVNVVPLPLGPDGPAGPVLHVEALLFNPHSNADQLEAALVLGRFLTNEEQGAMLMRETQRVSANRQVRVNRQTNPIVWGFSQQARTAVIPPKSPDWRTIVAVGDDVYTAVLAGEEEAGTAVCEFMTAIQLKPAACE